MHMYILMRLDICIFGPNPLHYIDLFDYLSNQTLNQVEKKMNTLIKRANGF